MSGMALRRGRKWNGLNFKQLGKVRVIIFENIFAIVVPVDLLSYIFGRWYPGFRICTLGCGLNRDSVAMVQKIRYIEISRENLPITITYSGALSRYSHGFYHL